MCRTPPVGSAAWNQPEDRSGCAGLDEALLGAPVPALLGEPDGTAGLHALQRAAVEPRRQGPDAALLRALQSAQADERQIAGSPWREKGSVFTTEFGGPCKTPSGRSKWRPPGRGCPRPGYTPEHSAASVLLTNVVPRSMWWSARSPATRRSPSPATSTATSRRTSHAGRSTFSAGADEMVDNPSQ